MELMSPTAITIFITGPRIREWGFRVPNPDYDPNWLEKAFEEKYGLAPIKQEGKRIKSPWAEYAWVSHKEYQA